MIILPDRNIVRTKILKPIPNWQWRTPSQAQPKSEFGHENHTRFRVTARLNDGHIVWRGWFDDRYDFDAFIHAMVSGTLLIQPALWDLPTPMWVPGMGEQLAYDFASTSYITTTATTSYTTPADWGTNNYIECIAGGGGGAAGTTFNAGGNGGGGGAYSAGPSIAGPGVAVSVAIGAAGTRGAASAGAGGAGGVTRFNGTSLATSDVGADGGNGGTSGTGTTTVTPGGAASLGIGTVKYSGGNGAKHSIAGGGGGGAAGPNGAGNTGLTGSTVGGTGGSGDAGFGGAGGAMNNAGTAGTEYTASIGCGGGGGGGGGDANLSAGSVAGNYGAGGGGGGQSTSSSTNGAAGTQGFMVITYTVTDDFFMFFH